MAAQPGDMLVELRAEALMGGAAAVLFGGEHVEELAAAGDEAGEFARGVIGERTDRWTNRVGEVGEDTGIEAIGLGELTGGAREVADLAWIDDGAGETGGGEFTGERGLQTTGGLEDDEGRLQREQVGDQSGDPGGVVGKRQLVARRTKGNVESRRRDINADE